MADDDGISIALTPIQLYAMLNGKDISQGELESNTWREMPWPSQAEVRRYLNLSAFPDITDDRNSDHARMTHWSRPPTTAGCWIPPRSGSISSSTWNRAGAVLQIVGAGAEITVGVLLILTPEPTMVTKVVGTVLTVHGTDFMQAAIRQLFSGKPVADLTQQGGTWAAKELGASDQTAHRVGVVLDVSVALTDIAAGVAKLVAIRAGRIILSEEAVAGKVGRVSLDVEEADASIGKEGGHALERHVDVDSKDIAERALKKKSPNAIDSRFFSKKLAEDAINDAIKANREAMRQWSMNLSSKTAQEFEYDCGKVIGEGYVKAASSFQQFRRVRVVLKVARRSTKIFYILTAYPVP